MATLYVTEVGARVEREYQRLLVTSKDDEVLIEVPLGRVSEVVLVGWVGVTTPALLALLDAGIGVSFITRTGSLRGRLAPPQAKNLALRHKQYERARDPVFCLQVSQAIVGGKLRNCRTVARRIERSGRDEQQEEALRLQSVSNLERLTQSIKQAARAPDLATLRGNEGIGSKAYFAMLKTALRQEMTFEKRTRRPPGDPVNALLSLGYTLLTQNLMTAAEIVGLDSYDGFFHADKYGRPSLALDLVEEWRPLVVDSIVQTLVNKRMLDAEDFEPGEQGGVHLTQRGLRVFFRQYSARLATCVFHPTAERAISYQKCFELQARALAKVIQGQAPAYLPFLAK